MIVFLNFAPIEFMGGAEKWMYETANLISRKEKTVLISVSPEISNIYSTIILGRTFDKRIKLTMQNLIYLTVRHFIPFTESFSQVRELLKEARLIYIKYEILEVLIVLYFGGLGALSKVVAGIHSPFLYQAPITVMERMHNIIYLSFFSRWVLGKVKRIHTITRRDRDIMENDFGRTRVYNIPTSVNIKTPRIKKNLKNELKILFVGELSKRKGIDILRKLIIDAPKNYFLDIVGNGPYKKEIARFADSYHHVKYHGYLDALALSTLYTQADVLLLPSRAEGFPLVFHEAMAHGTQIVDSDLVNVGLPRFIERSVQNEPEAYIKILNKIYAEKKEKTHANISEKIQDYYRTHFSYSDISSKVQNKLFA